MSNTLCSFYCAGRLARCDMRVAQSEPGPGSLSQRWLRAPSKYGGARAEGSIPTTATTSTPWDLGQTVGALFLYTTLAAARVRPASGGRLFVVFSRVRRPLRPPRRGAAAGGAASPEKNQRQTDPRTPAGPRPPQGWCTKFGPPKKRLQVVGELRSNREGNRKRHTRS